MPPELEEGTLCCALVDKVLFAELGNVGLSPALWSPASHQTSLAFRIFSLEIQELKLR